MVTGSSIVLPFLIPFILGFFYLIFRDNYGDITLASLYGGSGALILLICLLFAYGGPLVGGLVFYGENLSYCKGNYSCYAIDHFFDFLVGIIWIFAWSYLFSKYLWPILKKILEPAFDHLEDPFPSQGKNSDHSKQSSYKPKWSEPGFAARTFKATDSTENDNALTDKCNESPKAFTSNSLNEKTNIQLKTELRRLKKEWKKVSKEIDRKGGASIQTNELLGVRNSLMDNIMEIEKNLNFRNKEKRWF
jgi:hypothetical protein